MKKDVDRIARGDIYYANLDPVIGSEQGGFRPVLVVQNNIGNSNSPTVTVLPLTSVEKKKLPTHVLLPAEHGIGKESIVLAEHLRTIDKSRMKKYITTLSGFQMARVDRALRTNLSLPYPPACCDDVMILELCPACANRQYISQGYIVRRTDPLQKKKAICSCCMERNGYEYLIRRKNATAKTAAKTSAAVSASKRESEGN